MSILTKINNTVDRIGSEIKSIQHQDYITVTNGNIDLSLGSFFYLDLSANTTISFSNLPTGTKVKNFTVLLHNANTYTITWPSGLVWNNDLEPDISSEYFVIYFSANSLTISA